MMSGKGLVFALGRAGCKEYPFRNSIAITEADDMNAKISVKFNKIALGAVASVLCLSPLKLSHYSATKGRGVRWLVSDIRMRIA